MEMLQGRSLYNDKPPGFQSKLDVNPTLIVSWWATGFALTAILIRVAGRWVRVERLFREDKIMLFSIIPLLIRMALIHVVLIWGTNNTVTTGLTAIEIHHREIGAKVVLAARIFYALFIWIAKWTILEFLKRTMGSTAGSWHKSYEFGLRIIDAFLILTFIAVVIATLAECHPFSHYWQVVPDATPQCREGIAQLITMGVCDIVTDLVLVFFPIPLVVMSNMRTKRKISLVLLFLLSLGLVGITAYRVPATIQRKSAQQFRSLLASLEILAASAVSNAVVIGSFIRDRGVKKAKFRKLSIGEGSTIERVPTRAQSVAIAHWGSDDDLVRDLGLSLHPSLQHRTNSEAFSQPAPTATADNDPDRDIEDEGSLRQSGTSWNYAAARRRHHDTDADSLSSSSTDLKLRDLSSHRSQNPVSTRPDLQTTGKMSFFDVGGLVHTDKASTPPVVSRDSSMKDGTAPAHNGQSSQVSRSSSRAFLSDVGGLLVSQPEGSHSQSSLPTRSAARHSGHQSGSVRNFSRGGPSYNPGEPIAEHDARRPPPKRGVAPVAVPAGSGADGPDSMGLSDAGGLLG